MLRCHVVAARIPGATGFGPGVLLSVSFRGVPRRTQVVPEERSPTWNEELAWPLDACPLSATDALALRLRRGDCPLPQGDLGAATVSLGELAATPSLPLALGDIPLLDHRERPTGCTVTLCCYHGPRGDVAVTSEQDQVALEPPAVAPADRKEDFQVRVRVIRGRQLRGNGIRPVVRVQIGKRHFRSRSRSGNNPYFDEVFCQNFRMTPEQLVAQPIHIQVLRSPNICTKPVIGIFELDIGTVYSAPGRSLSGKWLSLQHPRLRDGRSQGWLQVSLVVRRAGESAQVSPAPRNPPKSPMGRPRAATSIPARQEQEVPAGDEDVEANLLRPPPCAATLQIRVFRAELLPLGGDTGDWGGDIGNWGGDTGNWGGDTGNRGGNSGDWGGNSGDWGGDIGNRGGDTGNWGGDIEVRVGTSGIGMGTSRLGWEHRELGWGHQELGWGHRGLGWEPRELGWEPRELGWGHRDVALGHWGLEWGWFWGPPLSHHKVGMGEFGAKGGFGDPPCSPQSGNTGIWGQRVELGTPLLTTEQELGVVRGGGGSGDPPNVAAGHPRAAEPRLGGAAGSLKASVRVGFAGRTLCTRWVPADASPEWNEVLFFPLRLPPICDEILLEILRGSCRSKAVGRATLRLSQISRDPDELEEGTPGFFPSFGPSFLPFYGPREDAARDSGPVYGGRLLLELCTHPGSPPGRPRDAAAPVDAERAQSRLPRCRLGLCGVFYSATMVPGGPEALSLELGIGSAAAATAPALPAFDGNLYHHLPWFRDKPVVAVTSLWEDAGHRWDSLNLLRALCQRLERNLSELQGHRGDSAGDIGTKLLQELEQDCEAALQCLEEQPALTALDQQLRSCRRRLLRRLRSEAGAGGGHGDTLATVAQGWLRQAAALAVEVTPKTPKRDKSKPHKAEAGSVQAPCGAVPVPVVAPLSPLSPVPVSPQPQAGVPDVQLWLLRGQLRVASARVAATDVLHSPRGPGACGRLCGRILTLFLVGAPLPSLRVLLVSPGVPWCPSVSPWCPFVSPRCPHSPSCPSMSPFLSAPCPLRPCSMSPPHPLCPLRVPSVSPCPPGCGDSQAQVRVRLWLGRVAESGELAALLGGSLRFYSETYEHQTRLLGKWGPRGLLGRPAFSDSSGRAAPPPDELRPPKGWRWDGPWSVERPRRVPAQGAGSAVLEELYENQSRDPSGGWASTATTDAKGVAVPPKEEVACPQGWRVTSDWHVDVEGTEDEDGWQYGVGTEDGGPPAAWHSKGQQCHTLRRRRWLRVRHRDSNSWTQEQDTDTLDPEELWEDEAWQPECFWGCSFQPPVPAGPRCRRRRWQRSLVPAEPAAVAPLFLLQGAPDTEEPAQDGAAAVLQQPPVFILCSFQRPGRFQLRCYIFQALDLAPGGSRISIDAAAQVSFVSRSQRTRAVRGALDPRWEQTLLFAGVPLCGDPRGVPRDPPAVVVEVCEQRGQGPAALLGRCVVAPRVWLDAALREPPRLQPHPLRGPRGAAGELLAAFELLHEPEDGSPAPLSPPPLRKDGLGFGIPPELRPRLQRVALEVLAWGLRGLRGAVREPRLELQWGEQSLWTPPIQDTATNPNFPSNAFLLTLALPEEQRFVPPIRLRLWHRAGSERRLLLGQASVRDLRQYRCHPPGQQQLLRPGGPGKGPHTAVAMPDQLLPARVPCSPCRRWWCLLLATAPARMAQGLLGCLRNKRAEDEYEEDEEEEEEDDDDDEEDEDEDEEDEEEEERDWWSRFYASMEDKDPKSPWRTNGDRLKIYGCELEAVPEFQGLQDFCQTFPLSKPGRAAEPVGSFKGLFRIYPVPEGAGAAPAPLCFQRLPPRQPQPCLVRVYVVRAFDLSPRDVTGLSDPYVRVALGKKTLGQRDQYVPNTLEPVFGRMFELTATIPLEKDLRVTIMDHDKVPPDQEIGSTTIDLEDRLLSQRRAHCGLPALYHTAGPACWRDQLCPSRALELLAGTRGLPGPRFSRGGTALSLSGQRFELHHFERGHPPARHAGPPRERLALHVLNLCELVPEHLETRGLQSRAQPGLEQGKVQMWVDIFPASLGPPGPPVNIDPRKAEGYELRCVVWNVRDADLGDVNLLGQRMSDIYVSGWLDGLPEQRQHTDIHYRSRNGSGAFNWRFVFPFEFLAAEKLCAIQRKEHVWSLDATLLKVPPKLILQVWDNDKFKADDLLGILELELLRLPRPARSPRLCRATPPELPWLSWPWLSRAWLCLPRFSRGWLARAWLSLPRCSRGWLPVARLSRRLSRRWCRAPALQRSPLNLFRRRRARGWWPCTVQEDGGQRLSGKLELSLELLTAREAEERPVGKGREEPNKHPALPEPRRPKSSFLWLRSPLSLVRHGIRWRYLLWLGLGLAALLLLLLIHSFFPGSLTVRVAEPRPLPPGTERPGAQR
ncbi:fer-1-like protein 5 [Passer domesticus]|uniref:fer-1-like protein 5 n=1 Tax=Passer domesticus TaxID=48849 RepID=UPI0030FE8F6C